MLAVGDAAPEFSEASSQGPISLKELRGSPVVLYFYPQADTPGCTIESKKFRDLMPKLSEKGVRVVGISTDSVADQQAFATKCSLPFPLVADATKKITARYGVARENGRARRVTFLLDATGKVEEIVDSGPPDPHIAAVARRYLGGP